MSELNEDHEDRKKNSDQVMQTFDLLESKVLGLVRQISGLKKEKRDMKSALETLEKELTDYKRNYFEINKKKEYYLLWEKENKRFKSEREQLCRKVESILESVEHVMDEIIGDHGSNNGNGVEG